MHLVSHLKRRLRFSTGRLMQTNIHNSIVRETENSLEVHGDTFRGVGWTKKKEYADLRYKVMLEGIKGSFARPLKLLDFGCGAAHLYEYIRSIELPGIEYAGLDLSAKFLELCRRKFPDVEFHHIDLLQRGASIPQ